MKQLGFSFVFILVCSLLPATVFHSQSSGNWYDASVWGTASAIPGPEDDVIIHGDHTIYADYYNQLSIRSLEIRYDGYTPGCLVGNSYDNLTLYVQKNVQIASYSGYPSILPGGGNEINLQLGGDFTMTGGGLYDVGNTLFTALDPVVVDNRVQLGVSGNPNLYTVFSTLNPSILLEVMTDITFPPSLEYGITGASLDLWPDVGFQNGVFNQCTFMPRTEIYVNSLANCHLYGCHSNYVLYLDGAVAMMDNYNVFNDLHILGSGCLWGNYNTASSVTVNGNLSTAVNSIVSAGSGGSLDLYVKGNLQIGGSFMGNTVYFDGGRDASNPQLFGRGGGSTVQGTFVNTNSTVGLNSNFYFDFSPNQFYAGALMLQGYTLSQVALTGATIIDSGTLAGCDLSWVTCLADINFNNCYLEDSNNICLADLSVNQTLTDGNPADISLRVVGDLIVNPGASIQRTGFYDLSIVLDGDLYNYGSITDVPITFNGVSSQRLTWNASSSFDADLACYGTRLVLNPAANSALDLNGHDFRGESEVVVVLLQDTWIQNASFVNLAFEEEYEFQSFTLDLANILMLECQFSTPVRISQDCIVNLGTGFGGLLTVSADLEAMGFANIVMPVRHLNVDGGSLNQGDYGHLTVDLSGNLNAFSGSGRVSQLSFDTLNLVGTEPQFIMAEVPLDCDLQVWNCPNVTLLQSLILANRVTRHFYGSSAPGAVVNLNGYYLSGGLISGGSYQNGFISYCTLETVVMTDVWIGGPVVLGDDFCRFEGSTRNYSTICGLDNSASRFYCYGDIVNYSTVTAGPGGTLDAYLCGNVRDNAGDITNWNASVHLVGTQDRNLMIGDANSVSVDNSAAFSLLEYNILPSFNIEPGSTLTVPSGSTLALYHANDWYGGNLVMNGTFSNRRLLELAPQVFHGLSLDPLVDPPDGASMVVSHMISEPANLPNSTGEYWSAILFETGSLNANLQIHYRGAYDPNQRLYYSIDNGNSWAPVYAPSQNDPGTNTLGVAGFQLPGECWLAISTLYDAWANDPGWTPEPNAVLALQPTFSWPAFYAAGAYRLDISSDNWQSIAYTSGTIDQTSHTLAYPLAPGTVYQWKVSVTSNYLGDLSSDGTRGFQTRPAMVCTLPSIAAYLPGDPIAYYLPAFIQNLLPGESFSVTPYSSASLSASYQDGLLTITPLDGWTGVETIDMQIADSFTVLNPSLQITVLGKPSGLTVTHLEQDGNHFSDLAWNAVPGATHYRIYATDNPLGPWNLCGWSSNPFISLQQHAPHGFYLVRAHTGEVPN